MNEKNWSFNGLVQYLDGEAWSVSKSLRTIWVGKEKMIRNFFETGDLPDLSPEHKRFLLNIRGISPMESRV